MQGDYSKIPARSGFWDNAILAAKEVLSTRLYWVLCGIVGIYCFIIWLMGEKMGMMTRISFFSYEDLIYVSACVYVIGGTLGRAGYIMLKERSLNPRVLFTAVRDDFKTFASWKRVLHAIPFIVAFPIFFSAFTSFKTLIPELNPFSNDVLIYKIDHLLHFGIDPWRILQPVLGHYVITYHISAVYKLWFLVKFICLFWLAFSIGRPLLRAQFFLAYLATWILNGTILAVLLSSAGPCFFSHIVGNTMPDPYAPLMEYLRQANEHYTIGALIAQSYLWDIYAGKNTALMSGISAMPSMHVSVAFMLLLLGWKCGPLARTFFTMFFILIFVGSIHLGWHYASDGYFAILTTWVIWRVCGRVVEKHQDWLLGVNAPASEWQGQKEAGQCPAG